MPLIMLMKDLFHQFERAAKRLDKWNQLVDLEALLIARGRAAFLVHWFGTSIPTDGFNLRVAIVNLEQLRRRYTRIMSTRRSQLSEGPSVLEPLSGMAGAFAGAALSPLHFLPIMTAALPRTWGALEGALSKFLFVVAVTLNYLTFNGLGLLVFAGLVALAPLAYLGAAFTPGTAEMQDFLTAVARLGQPLAEFWKQVSGPRDKVKNPIVRATLDILDKLAYLIPFLMATVAFLIAKVGPLLDYMYYQFKWLADFADKIMDLVKYIANTLIDLLGNWLDSKRSDSLPHYLKRVVKAFTGLIDMLSQGIKIMFFGDAKEYLLQIGYWVGVFFSDVGTWVTKTFTAILNENPLIQLLKEVVKRFTEYLPFLKKLKKSGGGKKSEDGDFTKALKGLFKPVGEDLDFLIDNPPKPDFLDPMEALRSFGLSPFPEIGPTMTTSTDPFAEFRKKLPERPRSIFAHEKLALKMYAADQFGMPTVKMAITQAHLDETRLREALLGVAKKVLPPAMRPYLTKLSDAMETTEKKLGQKPVPADQREFPVLALAEEDKLRPVVSRLVVRVKGSTRELTGEWTEGLRVALLGQLYPVSIPAGGSE